MQSWMTTSMYKWEYVPCCELDQKVISIFPLFLFVGSSLMQVFLILTTSAQRARQEDLLTPTWALARVLETVLQWGLLLCKLRSHWSKCCTTLNWSEDPRRRRNLSQILEICKDYRRVEHIWRLKKEFRNKEKLHTYHYPNTVNTQTRFLKYFISYVL